MRFAPPLLALALATSGCAALGDTGDAGGLQAAAAFYPLQYVTERVGGDLVDVDNLTAPGKESHDLELSVRETALIASADLVVYESDYQPAVDAGVEENAGGAVLDATPVVDLMDADEDHADEHDHEGETEEEHAEHEGDHDEDHEGHDHGDVDPHFWLDPVRMADLGDSIATELTGIDPDNASTYEKNAADLRSDLEALDSDYAEGLASCERNTIVVSHDAFGYLGKYDLEIAPVVGLSPDAEPTPAGLAELQELITDKGLTTVFSERLASPRFTESLASDLSLETATLDPLEGLTDETGNEDYLSLMDANLDALRAANGCR